MSLENREVQCPYCGENIEVEVEVLEDEQSFIQDCTVCCHPIQFEMSSKDDGAELTAARSD
jgi:hypothetical protein